MDPRCEYTLITGSCSGIGESLARKLAPSGNLILQAAERDELPSLFADVPGSHLTWRCDLEESTDAGSSLSTLLGDSGGVVSTFLHSVDTFQALPLNAAETPEVYREFLISDVSATT